MRAVRPGATPQREAQRINALGERIKSGAEFSCLFWGHVMSRVMPLRRRNWQWYAGASIAPAATM